MYSTCTHNVVLEIDFFFLHDLVVSSLLSFDGALVEEGALTAAVQGEKLKSEFMTLCVWLVKEMKGLCNIQENVSGK